MRVTGPNAWKSRFRTYEELERPVRAVTDRAGVPVTAIIHYVSFAKQALKARVTMEPDWLPTYLEGLKLDYLKSAKFRAEVLDMVLAEVVGIEPGEGGQG